MRPALSTPPRTTELPWHAEPGDAEALSGLSEVEHGGPQGRTRCRSPNKRCSRTPALTGRSALTGKARPASPSGRIWRLWR